MVAIVGAGAAGWSAAEALRELGYDGELRLFSAEPAAAYERPTLSKSFLTDDLREPPPLDLDNLVGRGDIALEREVEVVSIEPADRTLRTSHGEVVPYDKLLLATGAMPRRLQLPGADLDGVHYLRDVADATRLRAALGSGGKLVIVGGGVIGLEVASSALSMGCEVTVVEAAPQLMGRIVPSELADLLRRWHEARGVRVLTNTTPIGFEGRGRVSRVAFADGEAALADAVVVGVGSIPRTRLAAEAGLAVDRGIIVDEYLRTSADDVFAAGDVARVFHPLERDHVRIEQWRPAQEQGRHAARSILGVAEPYRDLPWMWSDQHDLHVQMSGFGFTGLELVRRGNLEDRTGAVFFGLDDGRITAVCGVSVGTGIARTIRAAQSLIEQNVTVDAAELADSATDLRKLARQAAEACARGTPRGLRFAR